MQAHRFISIFCTPTTLVSDAKFIFSTRFTERWEAMSVVHHSVAVTLYILVLLTLRVMPAPLSTVITIALVRAWFLRVADSLFT